MRSPVDTILRSFINLLFPPVCPLCRSGLVEDRGLCAVCLSGLKRIEGALCTVCGVPFTSQQAGEHTCGECIKRKAPFVKARSAFAYEGTMAEAIRRFKYAGDGALARPLGDLITEALGPFEAERPDLVVPVPLHKKRLRQRGFNQSLVLARRVASTLGARLDYLSLIRTRYTRPQIQLKERERVENVRGAFDITDPSAFKDRTVLLVDDVYTTGATVRECARVIRRAGGEPRVVTLARAVSV